MKSFKEFLTEVIANSIGKRDRMSKNTKIGDLERLYNSKFQEAPYPSVLPNHKIMISPGAPGEHVVAWVHKDTDHVDFSFETEFSKLNDKEVLAKNFYIRGRRGGDKISHHAHFDLMRGALGKPVVLHNDSESPGAVKLRQKMKKTYGSKVFYHTFDPDTHEVKHFTHGVSASDKTPSSLTGYSRKQVIVSFVPGKHRIKN